MSDSRKAYYDDYDDYCALCKSLGVKPTDSPYGLHAKWVAAKSGGYTQPFEQFELEDRIRINELRLREAEHSVNVLTKEGFDLQEKLDELIRCNQEQCSNEPTTGTGEESSPSRGNWWST